jgi:hypothetical protein
MAVMARKIGKNDELALLVPWHVNHTLSRAEDDAVRNGLRVDSSLKASLAAAMDEDANVKHSVEDLGAPSDKVLAAIKSRTEVPAPLSAQASDWIASLVAVLSPRRMAYAAAALALLAVFQAGTIAWLASQGTSSVGPSLASGNEQVEGIALVKLTRSTTVVQLVGLLDEFDLRVVDGPTAEGQILLGVREGAAISQVEAIEMLSCRTDVFSEVVSFQQ